MFVARKVEAFALLMIVCWVVCELVF